MPEERNGVALSDDARSGPGQPGTPGRRRLLASAAAGLVAGAGAVSAGPVVAPGAAEATPAGSMVTIAASGDASGARDAAQINEALSAGRAVLLTFGTYYVNATIEVPGHSALRGAGRDAQGSPYATTIQAVGGLPAVIASAGWLQNANASGVDGTQVRDLTVNGNSAASEGIVLQTFDGWVDNVGVVNMLGNGISWSTLSRSGQLPVSGNLSNNRVTNCVVSRCKGQGIGTFESATSDTYTDGFCTGNIVAGCGTAGIGIQQAADWLIMGNHVYTVGTHGIVAGDAWNTKVIGNEIDQWGRHASPGLYRAVDCFTRPSYGGINIIQGNVIDVQKPPGNPRSALQGINLACQAGSKAYWSVVGNGLRCEQAAAEFSYAHPLVVTNTAPTCTTTLASTGNLVQGSWTTSTWVSVPAGGAINHTSGI